MSHHFKTADFELFDIPTLAEQMPLVRRQIQPIFRYYGRKLHHYIEEKYGVDLPVYVAKHIQRRVNPLRHTWVALGGDQRGYKKYAHLEIGINRRFMYFMLCTQKNIRHKDAVGQLLQRMPLIQLPDDMALMTSHFGPEYYPLNTANLDHALSNFQRYKKADFQIGRVLELGDPMLKDEQAFEQWLYDTCDQLWALFQQLVMADARWEKQMDD